MIMKTKTNEQIKLSNSLICIMQKQLSMCKYDVVDMLIEHHHEQIIDDKFNDIYNVYVDYQQQYHDDNTTSNEQNVDDVLQSLHEYIATINVDDNNDDDDDIVLLKLKLTNELNFILSNTNDITKLKIARQQHNEYFEQLNVDDVENIMSQIDTTIQSLIETNEIAIVEFMNNIFNNKRKHD